MRGRKKWLFLTLVVLCGLALSITLFSGGQGSQSQGKAAKLLGPLPDLVEFYRTYGNLNDANWASFQAARRDDLIQRFKSEAKFKIGPLPAQRTNKIRRNLPREIIDFSSRGVTAKENLPAYRMFFDPSEQKRKGWSEDTFECIAFLQGDANVLAGAGARVISALPYNGGTIARIEVAGKDIEKVAALESVRSMAPAMRRDLDNDLGSASTSAPRLRLGWPGHWRSDAGITGKGVIVGLIDTGIDWSHADFIDPVTGSTRIQYIWDTYHTTAGRTPAEVFGGILAGLNWGTVWTRAEINAGLCTQFDTNGHGTHTSGTAAGNGNATGKYTGMAPNADIIMVSGLTNNGILFIYEMARLLNKPCSVNMSYGPSYPVHYVTVWPDAFPMDPTDMDGQWIDALNQYYGGGHIPVKSAGNIGHWNKYTDLSVGGYPYKQGGYHWNSKMTVKGSHMLNVPDYDALWNDWWGYSPGYHDVPELAIGGWLERPGDLTITDPFGNAYPFSFGVGSTYITPDGNVVSGIIENTPQANGAYAAYLWIYPYYGYYGYAGAAVQPTQGAWKFTLTPKPLGKGYADFWVSDLNWYNGNEYFGVDWWTSDIYTTFADKTSHSNYIVDEGSTPFEITVGAWTTRQGWDSIDGHSYTYTKQPWLKTIADFSSPGPARNRFTKPDIAAPGQIIISALTNDVGVNPAYIDPDNRHQAMSGTSMSAPFVTGGVALVLQKYPRNTVALVRDKLQSWATVDKFTLGVGPNGFGAGKLNLLPLKSRPVAVLTVDKKVLVLSRGDTATFLGSKSYDPDNMPWILKWRLLSSPEGAVCQFKIYAHRFSAELIPDPRIPGIYEVEMYVDGAVLDSKKVTMTVEAVK